MGHINLGPAHHAVHHAPAHHVVHHAPVHHAAPYHHAPAHHGYEHRKIAPPAESKTYSFEVVEEPEEARDAKAIDEAGAEAENAILEEEIVLEETPEEEVILEEAQVEQAATDEDLEEEAP